MILGFLICPSSYWFIVGYSRDLGINWASLQIQVAARLFNQSFPLMLATHFGGKDKRILHK